jgi:hypothetical protein
VLLGETSFAFRLRLSQSPLRQNLLTATSYRAKIRRFRISQNTIETTSQIEVAAAITGTALWFVKAFQQVNANAKSPQQPSAAPAESMLAEIRPR